MCVRVGRESEFECSLVWMKCWLAVVCWEVELECTCGVGMRLSLSVHERLRSALALSPWGGCQLADLDCTLCIGL